MYLKTATVYLYIINFSSIFALRKHWHRSGDRVALTILTRTIVKFTVLIL